MAKAFNHKVRREVTLPEDKDLDPAERTEFVFRPLTIVDESEIAGTLGDDAARERPMLYALEVVRHAMVDVRRWPNPAFDPQLDAERRSAGLDPVEPKFIRFRRGADGHADRELVAHLNLSQLLHLYREALRGETIEPVEAGKS